MASDRILKIAFWLYLGTLVLLTFAHIDWQAEIGNPFNICRVVALSLAGLLARLAYPTAPSFAFLTVIGTVVALDLAHVLTTGNGNQPLDIIIDMASGLWGVALGAVFDKLRMPSAFRRSATD